MTTFAEEQRARVRKNALKFKERIDRTMPEHAAYYCEHGKYVGFRRIFEEKCPDCKGEMNAPDEATHQG